MSCSNLNQRGDTIVEVLVAISIVSMIMGASYATATHALQGTRQAQESAEGSNYSTAAIEELRNLAPESTTNSSSAQFHTATNIYAPTGAFCITSLTTSTPIVSATNSNCMYGTIPYHVVIYNCDAYSGGASGPCQSAPAGSDTFVTQTTWSDILGHGTDRSTLMYRLHPSINVTSTPSSGPSSPPLTVSWFDPGSAGSCAPAINCSTGPGLVTPIDATPAPSLLAKQTVTITFDYSQQEFGTPPGERVPMPGDTGLNLKFCYKPDPSYAYNTSITIGGTTEYSSVSLNDNGINDSSGHCPPADGGNFVTVPISIPQSSNHNVVLHLSNGSHVLRLYDVTIY